MDLEDLLHVKSWRWFKTRVQGLLVADTRVGRHFAPKRKEVD